MRKMRRWHCETMRKAQPDRGAQESEANGKKRNESKVKIAQRNEMKCRLRLQMCQIPDTENAKE